MFVHDLRAAWEREQARRRTVVEADHAWVAFETDLPFPPSLVWDYLSVPGLEAQVLGLDLAERIDALGGRLREQAQVHCAHGTLDIFSTILDWKPFEYYTVDQSAGGLSYMQTRRLIPTPDGCRLGVYLSRPEENATEEARAMVQGYMSMWAGVGPVIERDVTAGKITLAEIHKPPQ